MTRLEFKYTMLKQDLKSKTEKVKYQKKIIERKDINKLLCKDLKKVYGKIKESTTTPKRTSVLIASGCAFRREQ